MLHADAVGIAYLLIQKSFTLLWEAFFTFMTVQAAFLFKQKQCICLCWCHSATWVQWIALSKSCIGCTKHSLEPINRLWLDWSYNSVFCLGPAWKGLIQHIPSIYGLCRLFQVGESWGVFTLIQMSQTLFWKLWSEFPTIALLFKGIKSCQ